MGYIDVEDVRVYLPDETEFPDDDIETAIDQMTLWVDGFMEIDDYFSESTSTDIYEDGSDSSILLLENEMRPLLTFTAIVVGGIDLTTDELANIRYDEKAHSLYYINEQGFFPRGFRNIKITGTFGYESVPTLVKNAITKAVVRVLRAGGVERFAESSDDSANISRVRIEDAEVAFSNNSNDESTSVISTYDSELDEILWRYHNPFPHGNII